MRPTRAFTYIGSMARSAGRSISSGRARGRSPHHGAPGAAQTLRDMPVKRVLRRSSAAFRALGPGQRRKSLNSSGFRGRAARFRASGPAEFSSILFDGHAVARADGPLYMRFQPLGAVRRLNSVKRRDLQRAAGQQTSSGLADFRSILSTRRDPHCQLAAIRRASSEDPRGPVLVAERCTRGGQWRARREDKGSRHYRYPRAWDLRGGVDAHTARRSRAAVDGSSAGSAGSMAM